MEKNKIPNVPNIDKRLVLGQDQNPYDTKKILLDYSEYKSLLEVSDKLKETEKKLKDTEDRISEIIEDEIEKIKNSDILKRYSRIYRLRIKHEWDEKYDTSKKQIEERRTRMDYYKNTILDNAYDYVNKYANECNICINKMSLWDRIFNWRKQLPKQLPKTNKLELTIWSEFRFGDYVFYSVDDDNTTEYMGVVVDCFLDKYGTYIYTVFSPCECHNSKRFCNSRVYNLKHTWYTAASISDRIEELGYKLDFENKKLIKL